ncbi:PREDICTED: uncharacterized protein LOC105550849 [Mandrillus leucophaeus]|uniref:uncharacterized protein LOC105550849 n=1 Tax=Mandrillus leucophaeus TaxID=9568 RepID=UPI0005F4E5AF|nr:PREDICTED: uncharacterized protein LOC105550849 [Mandrillus leucophaeus]
MTSSLNCYSLSLCGPLPGEGPTMRSGETLSREVSPHQVKQGKSSAGRGWIYSCLSPATPAAPGFLASLSTSALTGLGHFTAAGRKNGMDPRTSRQAQALPAGNLGMFWQMRPQALAMLYCHLCPGCTMWHDFGSRVRPRCWNSTAVMTLPNAAWLQELLSSLQQVNLPVWHKPRRPPDMGPTCANTPPPHPQYHNALIPSWGSRAWCHTPQPNSDGAPVTQWTGHTDKMVEALRPA